MQNGDDSYDFLYKIVLLGDMSVGKTCILSRYMKAMFPRDVRNTIGVEFATRTVALNSGTTVKAQFWDTAGQERYRAIVKAHYRRADGALIVYDVTNKNSLNGAAQWINELKDSCDQQVTIIVVGNKVDEAQENLNCRQVTTEEGKAFAEQHNALFYETSAKTGQGVRDTFQLLFEEINKTSRPKNHNTMGENLRASKKEKNSGCC